MHHDKIFRLPGAYRHLVTIAKNVRVAPVHTSKKEQQSYDSGGGRERGGLSKTDKSFDSDNLSDDKLNERISQHEVMQEKEWNESESESEAEGHVMDPPVWKTPADYIGRAPGGRGGVEGGGEGGGRGGGRGTIVRGGGSEGDYPFSSQVEKMWTNDVIPNLLHDIYSTSSSALHSSNIGLLPSALTKAVDVNRQSTHTESHSTSHSSQDVLSSGTTDATRSSSRNSDKDGDIGGDGDGKKDRSRGNGEEIEGLRISFSLCASTYATTFLDHLVDTVNKEVKGNK